MIVVWSAAALDDFDQTIAYLAERNPVAAARIADRIDRTARKLAALPTGRYGRVARTYEKVIPGLPYIIAYAIAAPDSGNSLVVPRIIHGARDWPPGRWPR